MQSADREQIEANKPHLSPKSVDTYLTHIKRVRKKAGAELRESEVLKYLDSLKPNIANQLISAVVALKPEFKVHVARYRKSAEAIRMANAQKATQTQRDNWTTVAAIKRAVRLMRREINQFGFKEHNLVMAYLIWSIMLEHTMRNDLPSVKIAERMTDAKPGENFYVVSKGEIWLNKFKTMKAFKRRELLPLKLKLSRSINTLILKFLRERSKSSYLLSHPNGKPYSRSAFRNLMLNSSKKYLGVKVGSTMLRHIVLSEFLKEDPSLAERKRKARSMQQLSLETQMSYQIRDIDVPKV